MPGGQKLRSAFGNEPAGAPAMIASWMPNVSLAQSFAAAFVPGHISYSVIFALLIVFFTFFYTAIQYNPNDIAENLKKSGAFIMGYRPGRNTAEYIDYILTRISLPGAIFLETDHSKAFLLYNL